MLMAINDIREWYAANMLKLNYNKTEMLVIGSKYRTIPQQHDLNVGPTVITPGNMSETWVHNGHQVYYGIICKAMQIAFLKIRQS